MSNSLDPDQARHIVGPDLGPNCLQMLSCSRQQMSPLADLFGLMLNVPVNSYGHAGMGQFTLNHTFFQGKLD